MPLLHQQGINKGELALVPRRFGTILIYLYSDLALCRFGPAGKHLCGS